jgi:hypothetical protein
MEGYHSPSLETSLKIAREGEILKTGNGTIFIEADNSKLDSETAHFDNRTVVERILDLSGGDQTKFGPGARARADARANSGLSRTGQTTLSGSSIFAKAFTPDHIYCNNYHNAGNKLSCLQAYNHNCPPGNQGGSIKLDEDGYCIGERGKKFVRVEHEHKIAKFETPESPNDPVQDASEVIGTEKISLTTDIRKRQIHSKSKHKYLFENSDGSTVQTYNEFRDSLVEFLKDTSDSKYVSDCILIGEGSEPKDALCVIDDKTRYCLVLEKTQGWNLETKSMEESPILEYVGPRELSKNNYQKFKPYGIIGSDGKDVSQARHGMQAKDLMEIRSNRIDPIADSGQCPPNEKK